MAECQGNPILAEMDWLYDKLKDIDEKLRDVHLTKTDMAFYLSLEEKYSNRLNELKDAL